MTPDQQLETAMLEGKLDITIQSIMADVDRVFERRMKRYEAYNRDSSGTGAVESFDCQPTGTGSEIDGKVEGHNEGPEIRGVRTE